MFPILIKDDFFSKEDLLVCVDYVKKTIGNAIHKDKEFTDLVWDKYKNSFHEINPDWIGLYADVTVSNSSRPVPLHKDLTRNDATQKILVYLNQVTNGGTIFYESDREILIENRLNRLVCFDISLYHKSQEFSKGRKLSIGFRPILKK